MKFWVLLILYNLITTSTSAQQKVAINWKVVTELPSANGVPHLGVAGGLSGVHNGVLIVAGGANFPQTMPWMGGPKKYHVAAYVFNKNAKGILNLLQTTRLPEALAYSASCTTPQGIICAGGEGDKGVTNKVALLQWNGGKLEIKELPSLPHGFTNAAITYCDGLVYLAGGENSTEALDQFLFLDMQNLQKGWQALPSLPQPTSHAVLVVQSGKGGRNVYLLGGRRKTTSGISELYKQVYSFNLDTKTWKEETPLPYALSAGSGIAAGSCSILLFGGDKGETFHKTERLIAAIKEEADEKKKEKLNAEKAALQSGHPGFSRDVLAYHTTTKQWLVVSTIPFDSPVTTTAVCWDGKVYLPSGEIRAGVRTPQILAANINSKTLLCP